MTEEYEMSDESLENIRRYERALHALQTGVSYDLDNKPEEPKHIRTGINSAFVDSAALAGLLMKKGVITNEEYTKAVADGMEIEVARYEKLLSERFGREVVLK